MNGGAGRAGSRRELAAFALLSAMLFLPGLAARDLWNPNEPLYGRVVVEMYERGDWWIPTFNGRVFDEKPILYFWLALGLSTVAGGVSEWSLRLPSALAGSVGVALVYRLALTHAGHRRARIAAALFATTYLVFWSARSVQMDLLLSVTTLAAVLAGTRAMRERGTAVVAWSLCGASVGLGFLAKGPVGVICPLLALGAHAAVARVLPSVRGTMLATAVAAVVAVPWLLVLLGRGQHEFLDELLVRQNVTRFLAPWDHERAWWYFLLHFWLDMAPWGFLLLLVRLSGREAASVRLLDRWCVAWILTIVAFFSLSASKRSPYILPVAPAVAILAAGTVERWLDRTLDPVRRAALWLIAAAMTVALPLLGGYAWLVLRVRYPTLAQPLTAAAVVLGVGALAAAWSLARARARPALAPAALFATVVALYLLAATWALPALDPLKSSRPFCEEVRSITGDAAAIRSYRGWEWRAGYIYYLGREIPRIETPAALRAYWESSEPVFLVVEDGQLDEVRDALGSIEPLVKRPVGSKTAYLFTNARSRR
ncbi:MAG TPA: glycosyltransferase family 39 protein [Candidatus Polarisedimenticolaceae bacterium]|nr:glycosyltransferase family 39 protein [Candidatus Polarisedimenticolaceae bacterium]